MCNYELRLTGCYKNVGIDTFRKSGILEELFDRKCTQRNIGSVFINYRISCENIRDSSSEELIKRKISWSNSINNAYRIVLDMSCHSFACKQLITENSFKIICIPSDQRSSGFFACGRCSKQCSHFACLKQSILMSTRIKEICHTQK